MPTHLRPVGPRLARLAAAATCALGLACTSLPSIAEAADPTPPGKLAVYGCRLPDGSPAPINGWNARLWGTAPGSNTGATIDDCARGGTFAATTNSSGESVRIQKGMSVGWLFQAPEGLKIEGLKLMRETYVGQVGPEPGAERTIAGFGNGMPGSPWSGAALLSEVPLVEAPLLSNPAVNRFALSIDIGGRSWNQTAFWIQCNPQAASGSCPTAYSGSGTFVSRSTVILADDNAPVLSSVSGSMTQPAPLAGDETLTINASDAGGSGIYRVLVDVGGREIPLSVDDNNGKCRDAQPGNEDPNEFVASRPCLTAVAATLHVDTTSLPEGQHLLKILVEDASGRRSLGYGPQKVTVDNVPGTDAGTGPRPGSGTTPVGDASPVLTPNGSGASAAARLTATFARTTKRTITVRYGRSVTITGRLLNAAGRPIAGARLDVQSLVRTVGGTYHPQGHVVSDAKGDFRYVVPKGPSRAIRFAYRRNLQDSDYSQTSTVELKVVPSISLSANKRSLRNKQSVRLAGRIAGAPRASRKLVEIQALDGRRWRTIASTRLRAGRFDYAYRFMRTRGLVTYAFRARVRTETGWTFASGESKAVKVTVRG